MAIKPIPGQFYWVEAPYVSQHNPIMVMRWDDDVWWLGCYYYLANDINPIKQIEEAPPRIPARRR